MIQYIALMGVIVRCRCNLLDAVLLLPRPEALQSHIDPRWTAVGIDTLYWANALLSFGRINPHVSGLEYLGSQQATSEQSGNESAIRLAADDGEHKDEALRESFALSAGRIRALPHLVLLFNCR
jgi:hypothetical protein